MSIWDRIKSAFLSNWQKLLDQIPDQDRPDSYRYDDTLQKWVLLSTLPQAEVPILDENRRLQVETPNFKVFDGSAVATEAPEKLFYIKLDFLADSITSIYYDVVPGDNDVWLYYALNGEIFGDEFQAYSLSEDGIFQVDVKPWYEFFVKVICLNEDDIFKWKLVFSKQKKTKISDTAYDATVFNGITDIGLSKNVLRDELVSHYGNATEHHIATVAGDLNLNDLAEKLHASLSTVTANQHHNESHNHNLNDLAEKLHASLATVTTSQHHIKYSDSDAVGAVNASGLSLASTKVIISADENLEFIFGKLRIDDFSYGVDYVGLCHRALSGAGNYGILLRNIGDISLNAVTARTIGFLINNVTKMQMSATLLTMSVDIAFKDNHLHGVTIIYADGVINFFAFNDNSNYFRLGVDNNVPYLDVVGNNGRIRDIADPLLDQDVATKIYVDVLTGYESVASDDLVFSNDTDQQTTAEEYLKMKEIISYHHGTVRVYWEAKQIGVTDSVVSRLYINGVGVGSEYTDTEDNAYQAHSEDYQIDIGDLIQIYAKRVGSATTIHIKNQRIKYIKFVSNDP